MSDSPVISLQHIHKHYAAPVLTDINLEVQAGEIVGYIGPNGAGKSTTIKILTGIIPDFEGEARVLGMDVRKEALDIKRRIGYIPENAALYDVLTPMEYLEFIGQLYQIEKAAVTKKGMELLQLFELGDKAAMRMTTFSKGMRQKVLLIAGLINNPDVIFLDEPLSGLDANAVILVKEILAKLAASGKTIFYSSHIMDVVEKISNRIVIINKGKVIANGSFAELDAEAQGGSLEEIFTQLTGDKEHSGVADKFIDALAL
jgi:ABC-2 type transport system ATP-binding protein